jgi:large subunit ribosomal protein L10
MDRATKEQQVDELKEKLGKTVSLVLADYRGIDVPSVTSMRQEFKKAQCEYKVYKNTLVKLAIKGTKMEPISPKLEGTTAIIFSFESPSAAAKLATRFAKEQEKFVLKGAFYEGTVFDDQAGVEALAAVPGKDEMRAKLLATLMAPATELVRTLNAGPQNFMYLLAAKERAA